MTPPVGEPERTVDLRLLRGRPLAEGWSRALGLDASHLVANVLAGQVGGIDNPLLPDILGVARALAEVLASRGTSRLLLIGAAQLDWDDRRVVEWLRRDLIRRGGQVVDLAAAPDTAQASPGPTSPTARRGGEVQRLAHEGRALAALSASPPTKDLARDRAVEDLLVLASACLCLDQFDTARSIGLEAERVADDPALLRRAVRRQVLATRSLGQVDSLPALRQRLLALPRPAEALAAAWLDFDLAVASSFDPLRLGYRELLERARRVADQAGDPLLVSACDLWLAAFHFHAGDLGASVSHQRLALDVLDDVGAIRRSLPVRLRMGSTLIVLGRLGEAASVLEAGAHLGELSGLPAVTDAMVLALCRADPARCPCTPFASDAAVQLEAIRDVIVWQGVPPSSLVDEARVRVTRPDLAAQLELVLLERAHLDQEREAAASRLAEALRSVTPEFGVLARAQTRALRARWCGSDATPW